jgi:glutamine synthetase
MRGKRVPIAELGKLYGDGFRVPSSIMLLDVTGTSSDPGGRGFSDGDPDVIVRPIPGTLHCIPWAKEPIAQVLGSLYESDGAPCYVDPRNILGAVFEKLNADGLFPVTALELEFYLIDPIRTSSGGVQPPILSSSGQRMRETQVYSISDIESFSDFLGSVSRACEMQNIYLGAASAEYARGQYEINLNHLDNVQLAADQAILLQRAVRGTARQHGVAATFMAKPYPNDAGSGLHVHLSLLNDQDENIFNSGDDFGSAVLRHAIAGLLELLPESMALFAPNVNSYRRFIPNLFVPINRSWGYNNRSVAVRVPPGDGQSRRFEHRVSGADANPYLVLAAVLAGVHHGIKNRLDSGEPIEGNAGSRKDLRLPFNWQHAIDMLSAGQVIREYLGAEYVQLYSHTKQSEHDEFHAHISSLEFEWYLNHS